jgi:hypothetical protein
MKDIRSAQQRTLAYWFVDGIPEIAGGAGIVVVGLFLYLAEAAGNDVFNTLALLTMLLLFPASARVVSMLKERITYPRTGYVKYAKPSGQRRVVTMVISMVAAAALVAYFAASRGGTAGASGRGFAVAMGCAVAVAYVARTRQTGLRRFSVVAGLILLLSVGVAFTGYGLSGSLGLLWMGLGVLSGLSGAVSLSGYMRDNPLPGSSDGGENGEAGGRDE